MICIEDNLTPDQDYFSQGMCHAFAVASVRRDGGRFLAVVDYDDLFFESDDGDCDVPAVFHVFSVHTTPSGPIARDVFGERPLDEALKFTKEFFLVEHKDLIAEEISDEDLLREWYVDDEGTDERPLIGLDEDDIIRATDTLEALFPLPEPVALNP